MVGNLWLRHSLQRVAIATVVSTTLVTSCASVVGAKAPVVRLESGAIAGSVTGDVAAFKGIPYAAPPVGALRWRSPQPVKPWTGTRAATAYGNDCMQFLDPGEAAPPGMPPAEDCLFVNVWRPAQAPLQAKLPVVVWLHGGGFVNGGTSTPIYDGSAIAAQGVVVVSPNYRLGRFGFFAHPALTAAKEGAIANYGLMDQQAALQWVQRNIAAFGGDPTQVTLMGESAGGISVMHWLTSPPAPPLFQRAIVLSGGGRDYLVNVKPLSGDAKTPSAEQSGIQFAASLGIQGTGADALKALRALPAKTVAGDLNMTSLLKQPPTYSGGPILDGQMVTATPGAILQQGGGASVPILIGTTTQDLPAILPNLKNPFSYFGLDAAKAQQLYGASGASNPLQLLFAIGADIGMHEPARFVANQMTGRGQAAWLYRFGYVADSLQPQVTGAPHASELPFLFGTVAARYGQAVTPRDRAASQTFQRYMVNFIKTGNPNGAELSTWAQHSPARPELMLFTLKGAAEMQPDPWRDRLDLAEKVANGRSPMAAKPATLAGTSWQLVQFQGGDGTTLVPQDKTKYTIAFNQDNSVNVRFDCNRGRGTWQSPRPNQLQFGPLALTRAACLSGSLHDRLAKDWSYVRSYVLKNDRLALALLADGGIYEFEPLPTVPR